MSREKDQLTNTQDAGYKGDSGNHAAGGRVNDTTQVNKEPNLGSGANRQSAAAGSSGGMDMTDQSIGGQGAQDGIRGTPSGTQGGQSGQGIDQGGQSQQSAQGRPDGTQLDPQERNRDQYGRQQTGATSGEVGDSGYRGNQQSDRHGAGSGQVSREQVRPSHQDDGSAPGAGTSQRGAGGSQQLGGQQSSTPGGSGDMATPLKGGPGNSGLSQMKEQDRQGGPGNQQSHAGTGHGHGGQHSGGMGGERGGDLHNVGAQSGQTGRGGLGGNNVEMQGSSKGNQQSGSPNANDGLIGQQTQGSGGSTSADRDSLDALPADAMGGERVGMGSRGHSQQSDKAGNAQADTWSNQARPNNRSDNEQADRQLGMQGSPGEPGHDIDDVGSKQSGGGGSRDGSEDQR